MMYGIFWEHYFNVADLGTVRGVNSVIGGKAMKEQYIALAVIGMWMLAVVTCFYLVLQ